MKKIVALLLLLSLFVGCFAACGKGKDDDAEDDSGSANTGNNENSGNNTTIEDVLREVLPGADNFEDILQSETYPEQITTLIKADKGYVVVVNSKGYSDGLSVMCGIDNEGKIVGVQIIGNNEIKEYADKVIPGVDGLDGAYTGMDITGYKGHMVSGATQTSNGVASAVKLALEIVSGLIIENDKFDLLNDDLTEYIEIDEKYYKNYEAVIDPNRVTEFDIENEIIKVLCDNKSKESVEGDGIISIGDVADIYYRGYTITEDGAKNYFDGGCNFASAKPHSLEIGSGSFIPGFEYNLIGKNASNYATFEKVSSGSVNPDDIILITYSVLRADGSAMQSQSAIVDLSDPNLDEKWGAGFADYFKNNSAEVDKKIDSITVKSITDSTKTDIYTDITVVEIYRINDSDAAPILVVNAYFPEEYQVAELEGVTAYFEVFVMKNTEYDAPELTDAFITDTLKIADKLTDYEGDTLIEKYRAYLREKYMIENGLDTDTLVQNAFWASVMKGAVVKKYPIAQVMSIYNSYVAELEYYYKSYSYYYTYEDFMCLYIGLDVGSDWRGELRKMAESQLKQELIFYGIMQKENLKPTDEEYEKLFDEYIVSALESTDITPDDFATEAEYNEAKAKYKAELIEARGEDYFKSMIYYRVTMEAIVGYATIINP